MFVIAKKCCFFCQNDLKCHSSSNDNQTGSTFVLAAFQEVGQQCASLWYHHGDSTMATHYLLLQVLHTGIQCSQFHFSLQDVQ